MDYEVIHDITSADIAVRIKGDTLAGLFVNAGNTLMSELMDDITMINREVRVTGELRNDELDMLYFEFLNEFIFYKDSQDLLLLPETVEVTKKSGTNICRYTLAGEQIDRERHTFRVDIKAVTLHGLKVYERNGNFIAVTVFDV
ncbi:MAG TPA: archease [Spirochaetota bacterium]|nr:archease [Spirochaetota bacterium]